MAGLLESKIVHGINTPIFTLQIKRILPSGAASRSGRFIVGDRLVSCNGQTLRGVSQAQCLGILKTEANNGDLEIEVLRQTEKRDQCLEISVQVPNRAGIAGGNSSTLTLRSPNFEKKEFLFAESTDSENEVVLNKYNFLDDRLRFEKDSQLINGRSVIGSEDSAECSENVDSELDLIERSAAKVKKLQSMEQKGPSGGEGWGYPLPPPAEFSAFGPAVPPPEEFSEGQSPIFNQSANQNVPVTNIDDILTSYPDAPSEFQQSAKRVPEQEGDLNSKEEIEIIADVVGLERKVSENGPLSQINEIPSEFNGDCKVQNNQNTNDFGQRGFVHQGDKSSDRSKENICSIDSMKQSSKSVPSADQHGDNDSDLIVPVAVKRKHLGVVLTNIPQSNVEDSPSSPKAEEDIVVPVFKTRENSAPITKSVDKQAPNDIVTSPVLPRNSRQMDASQIAHPPPPTVADDSDPEDHVQEEVVMPMKAVRENSASVLEAKLGRDIEETIEKTEVQRDSSWNTAKLAVLTNVWAKSAAEGKSKEKKASADKSFDDSQDDSKKLKSVIGIINTMKENDNNVKTESVSQPEKIENVREILMDASNESKTQTNEGVDTDTSYSVNNLQTNTEQNTSAISTIKVENVSRRVSDERVTVNSNNDSENVANVGKFPVLNEQQDTKLAN